MVLQQPQKKLPQLQLVAPQVPGPPSNNTVKDGDGVESLHPIPLSYQCRPLKSVRQPIGFGSLQITKKPIPVFGTGF
jgi:hypothetical protein